MIDIFKKQILRLLRHDDYRPAKPSELAKSVGAEKSDYNDFKKALADLQSQGQVVIGSKNLVSLPGISGRVYGTFRANPKGFGFVIPAEPNSHGDLFIPPGKTSGAMTGDVVIAKVVRSASGSGNGKLNGKIVEILERATNRFVGTIIKKGRSFFLKPDGRMFTDLVEIPDITAKNGRGGDKAVVEMLRYPENDRPGKGVIIEILGRAGAYETEIKAVIHQFNLPGKFSDECIGQASSAAKNFDPKTVSGRKNITAKIIITIDPPDARDFDDAISIDRNDDGSLTLGVHIADVSAFIKENSPLDVEAKKRGNSVYLPQRTIPMLPEVLSNGICSLQPGQERLAKSVFITYDSGGKILKSGFANTVICSHTRLTYRQAEEILNGRTDDAAAPEAVKLLKDMQTLARRIEARRRKAGMLHLDLPDIELIFDKAGRVIDAGLADESYPHTIIEMFMVEANEAVAEALRAAAVANMRRIHPEPDSLSLKNLRQTLKILGYPLDKTPDRFAIQQLLDAVRGTPTSFAVNRYVLRSLARAEYSPLNIGHYALASKNYGHFTSPIRRYADLTVHRLLDLYIKGKLKATAGKVDSIDELAETGRHITFTERRADEAENDLKKVLILIMLQNRIGSEIDAVVSGLTNFGLFLQCRKFGIEGLVPLEMLGDDSFKYDQKAQCVYGENSGETIRIGKLLKARIVSVNLPARQLNLVPAENVIPENKKIKKVKKVKKVRKVRKVGNVRKAEKAEKVGKAEKAEKVGKAKKAKKVGKVGKQKKRKLSRNADGKGKG